jgi:hypothetical protein
MALLVLAIMASGCGDDAEEETEATATSTTTTTAISSTSSTTTTTDESTASTAPSTTVGGIPGDELIPDYVVEVPVEYVGQELDGPPEGRSLGYVTTESRSERSTAGFGDLPRVVLMSDLVLAGQLPGPTGEPNGFAPGFPLQVTDGLRLITEEPGVWLRIQCAERVGGDGVGAVAVMWQPPDWPVRALQLWDYDAEQASLIELDPDTYRLGGCMSDSPGAG